ncbi:BON domain-containing protein [Candidatus Paracaedibacter symbiosus]|uniref:BON domain-containing protein n=1 Tax=Candidatus Paracaedibacter symbiosus TaxID=244582 RepID=UPI00068CF5E2|nr:BON domain-containing protein [Candidatus Paracaedibacter symbiosus]
MSRSDYFIPEFIIKSDIQDKLANDPGIYSHNIVVSVENGLVVLSGTVNNYFEKVLAEDDAKAIRGVKGVVNELQISLENSLKRSDEEIAKAAIRALESDVTIPVDQIKVIVEHGIIKLSGEVNFYFQRENAYKALKNLYGVKDIINNIIVKPLPVITPTSEEISNRILTEFQRNAALDARHVRVEIKEGGKVILKGQVNSWAEYEEARHAALSVPGVAEIDTSELIINYG